MRSIAIIYATSTGHTEHVVDGMIETLKETLKDYRILKQRAEVTKPEDLTKSDILILASGTWNTGNVEGQLNPHMHDLLVTRATAVDLQKLPAAAIGLGDDRYYFTARAADKLTDYLQTRGAKVLLPTLKIINEPYGQEAKVQSWAQELAKKIASLPAILPKTSKLA